MMHGDVLGERARLTPEKTALVFVPTGERFTYRALDERAARTARALVEVCGLQKGDRVGFLAHNRVEFLDVFFAAAKSGLVFVPLSTRLTAHELSYIAESAGLSALVYGAGFEETVEDLLRRTAGCAGIALDEPAVRSKDEKGTTGGLLRKVDGGEGVRLDAPAAPARGRLSTFIASLSSDISVGFNVHGFERCAPEDLLALLYTSGTTGKPKGVRIPHRMVAWNAVNTAVSWQLREDDVSPIYTPLYHAGGLGAFLLPMFAIGGTVVLHGGFDAEEVLATIGRERCTVVLGVPTIFRMLRDAAGFEAADFTSVRWFISGGAPLPLDLIEAWQERGVVFKQGYGLTEVGVNCFSMTVEESVRKAGSIGKPLMFTQARLVDEAGTDVAEGEVGEVGELLLRGGHVCQGYWNDPESTRAALDAEGWFHTGDLAKRDAEGFYTIAGRKKDMFISGGVNVYPAEIEAELFRNERVKDVAVVGVPDEKWGEVGVAFVVPRGRASKEELTAFLEERLARYKIPREFVFIESLPRTPYGKVVKGELQQRYLSEKEKA
jgi:fatty-acyl-CoA synthase